MPAIDIASIRAAASCQRLAIETVDETGSTNRVLMDAPFGEGVAPPRLLAAARQTAGRGRRGRGWVMEPGRSAAFSIAIERRADGTGPAIGLSVVAGVAAAGALAGWAPDVRLKWPNDLQRARRKLGGILVESRRSPAGGPGGGAGIVERYVVGIGLNLLPPIDPEDRIGQAVTGLFDGDVMPVSPEFVIGRVAAAVVAEAERFFREGLAPFREAWDRFDALRDERVALLSDGAVTGVGVARGIDANGALLLETEAGLRAVGSGEVSVRPVADARSTIAS